MSTQSLNVSACIFPELLEKEVEKVEYTSSLEIEVSSLKALENVFEKDPTDFKRILRVCWAIVLRCYVGIDNVSFAYEEEVSPGQSSVSTVEMDFGAFETFVGMVGGERTSMVTDVKTVWKNVNSAILIRKVLGAGELQKPTKTVVSPEVRTQLLILGENADRQTLVPPSSPCEASERELPDLSGSLDRSDILRQWKEYRIYFRRDPEPNFAPSRPSIR